jgi:hypothetical protein
MASTEPSTEPSIGFLNAARAATLTQNLPLHEKIFHEAFQDARDAATNEGDRKLLTLLTSIQDPASIQETFEKTLQNARASGPLAKKRMSRKIARLCTKADKTFQLFLRLIDFRAFIHSSSLAFR